MNHYRRRIVHVLELPFLHRWSRWHIDRRLKKSQSSTDPDAIAMALCIRDGYIEWKDKKIKGETYPIYRVTRKGMALL